jgi:hypothetical protein
MPIIKMPEGKIIWLLWLGVESDSSRNTGFPIFLTIASKPMHSNGFMLNKPNS